MSKNEPDAYLPRWAERLRKPHRYKSIYGGRAGAKSWTVARVLLAAACEHPLRVLCAREFQTSIKDSVHRLLRDQAAEMELPYKVTQSEIRNDIGSLFLFEGIRNNVSKIRSMEGIDRCWIEEAQSVSNDSYNVLIPTIRKEGSELWLTWNPDQSTDPTYRRFIANPPPDCLSVNVGWQDNPWISTEMIAEKDYLYSVDPDAAAHVWGGETRQRSKAQILHGKWVVEPFEPKSSWDGPYQGADWGFSTDPSVLVRCWVSGKTGSLERELWIEHEAYGVGVDNDELPMLFDSVPDARKYTTRADNARPETISHMKNHGYSKMVPVNKWAGSVEDGIQHLRGYKRIIIHPRCKHAQDEARLYSYKTDARSGDVLPVIVDRHNHVFDAIRYACQPLIKHRSIQIDPMGAQNEQKNPWKV